MLYILTINLNIYLHTYFTTHSPTYYTFLYISNNQIITPMWTKLTYASILYFIATNICRLYTHPHPPSKSPALLIAHPDDESMFFSPLLLHEKPFIICLSNGNYQGLGAIRSRELGTLCRSLGLQHAILSYEDNKRWNTRHIVRDIIPLLIKHNIATIFTFDRHGVSGHHNHTSCHKAVRLIQKNTAPGLCNFHYLVSSSIFSKYVVDLSPPNYTVPIAALFCLRNMLFHSSQFAWFRLLYCLTSNYSVYNRFS